MKQFLLLPFLLLGISISAQHKIGDLLESEKRIADSLMRIQYGEELFNNYFILNPESGGRTTFRFQHWNDSTSDSIRYYFIWYYFSFPGAKIDSSLAYEFYGDENKAPSRGVYSKINSGECMHNTSQMNSVAIAELRHPLSQCIVRLYEYTGFNDSLYFELDSSHIFLEIEYDSLRYYGWKSQKVHLIRSSFIIDGCNGVIVSRNTLEWKGLNENYKGVPDKPCVR